MRSLNEETKLTLLGIFGASLGYASQWSSLQPHGLTVPDPVAKCFTEIIKRGKKALEISSITSQLIPILNN